MPERSERNGYKDDNLKDDNLTGTLIADLVLQIFAYVAQTEREFIRQRQAEGIAAAKAKGKKLGRKCIEMPDTFETTCEDCRKKTISTREAAKQLGISHTTFYRRYKEYLSKKAQKKHKIVSNSRLNGT